MVTLLHLWYGCLYRMCLACTVSTICMHCVLPHCCAREFSKLPQRLSTVSKQETGSSVLAKARRAEVLSTSGPVPASCATLTCCCLVAGPLTTSVMTSMSVPLLAQPLQVLAEEFTTWCMASVKIQYIARVTSKCAARMASRGHW
mgnify:CR=1 FL=1